MRQKVFTLFDEFVPSSATSVMSDTDHNETLASQDQAAMHVVINNVTGAGAINIFVEESGDGRLWIQRNNEVNTSTIGDISLTLAVGQTYQARWSDPGSTMNVVNNFSGTPFLGLMRLRIVNAGAAHVRVTAVLRGPQ